MQKQCDKLDAKGLVKTMSEEVKKDAEFPYRAASPEFFFLLQRIDRFDEKLSARISQVEINLRQEIKQEAGEFKQEIGILRQEIKQEAGAVKPLIWAAIGIVLASLALSVSVAIKIWT